MQHHGAGLRRLLRSHGVSESDGDELVSQLETEFRSAELQTRDAAMLAYAHKLTLSPAAIGPQDVEQLREHGFDERAIHDICAITAYFAFVNRIADGLGVEIESD